MTRSPFGLWALVATLVVGFGVAPARAQDTVTVGAVVAAPAAADRAALEEVGARAVEFYNRPRTIRLQGRAFVPDGRSVDGDVGVLGGPVTVEGRIAGDLVVINGDLSLSATAQVDGDVTVVGGRLGRVEGAQVLGEVTVLEEAIVVQRAGDELVFAGVSGERRRRREFRFPIYALGSSDLLISGGTYNRVEGLPISVGPRIVTGGSNPLRVELLGIYRSESGFRIISDELGYFLRARQYFFGRRAIFLEATFHSVIEPIERRGLSNLETGLSTWWLHRDYRDHYERRGWSAAVVWEAEDRPLALRAEYRDERHGSVLAGEPWTILDNGDPFRPNAKIDGGDLRSLRLGLRYDTRNEPDRPWTGWLIEASYEVAVSGRLSGLEPEFGHLVVDLRRYNRVSRSAGIDIRLTGGGRIHGDFLPAQRQHALGAEGSLPGYQRFEFDCGWRRGTPALIGIAPGYGCERFALVQLQYRGSPRFKIAWGGEPGEPGPDRFRLRLEPALVVFYDAGVAWNGTGFWDQLTESNNWVADVGVGVEFGAPGLYVAIPLREGAKGSNLFVRLSRRI